MITFYGVKKGRATSVTLHHLLNYCVYLKGGSLAPLGFLLMLFLHLPRWVFFNML